MASMVTSFSEGKKAIGGYGSKLTKFVVDRKKLMAEKLEEKYGFGFKDYPDGKSKTLKCGFGVCVGSVPKDAEYVHKLELDLANSYYWTGNCMIDFLYFVANWHPFLGIFLCHPNHPWTKRDRILMYAISLSITVVPAVLMSQLFPEEAKVISVVFITIPNTILGVVLYQIAISQTRSKYCSNGCFLVPCIAFIKNCCLCYALCLGTMMTCTSLLIMTLEINCTAGDLHCYGENEKAGMYVVVMGQVYSWIIWFPLYAIIPCEIGFFSLWCMEKEAMKMEASGGLEQAMLENGEFEDVGGGFNAVP